MLKRLLLAGVTFGGIVLTGAAQATPIVIDSFDPATAFPDVAPAFGPNVALDVSHCTFGTCAIQNAGPDIFVRATDASAPGTIIGGDRELSLANTNNTGMVSAFVAPGTGGAGTYTHGNTGGAEGTSLLVWDGPDGTDGLDFALAQDFSAIFSGNIVIRTFTAELPGASFVDFTIHTDADTYTTLRASDLGLGGTEHLLPVSLFANGIEGAIVSGLTVSEVGSDGNADLSNIGAISLFAFGVDNFDIEIDQVSAVPEPFSIGLFGLGLLGLGLARRRSAG